MRGHSSVFFAICAAGTVEKSLFSRYNRREIPKEAHDVYRISGGDRSVSFWTFASSTNIAYFEENRARYERDVKAPFEAFHSGTRARDALY